MWLAPGRDRQAGGHWFEPSTAHRRQALLCRAFCFQGDKRLWSRGNELARFTHRSRLAREPAHGRVPSTRTTPATPTWRPYSRRRTNTAPPSRRAPRPETSRPRLGRLSRRSVHVQPRPAHRPGRLGPGNAGHRTRRHDLRLLDVHPLGLRTGRNRHRVDHLDAVDRERPSPSRADAAADSGRDARCRLRSSARRIPARRSHLFRSRRRP